jgi:hypothetical protein
LPETKSLTEIIQLTAGPDYIAPSIRKSSTTISTDPAKSYGSWDPSTISSFLPERWLQSDFEGAEPRFNARAGPSHPFGAGPRGCFGRRLASMELKIVLTLIIWKFELLPTPRELSSFMGHDVNTHVPQQCYLRLKLVEAQ